MNTRALILAGGGRTGLRWPAPPGVVPRHMVPIRGEPMIHRTTRMLAERGIEDIRVFADPSDTDYIIAPAVHEHPRVPERPGRTFVQEWEPSMHRWPDEGRCMILYGDVFFTETLMDAMVADDGDPWNVYARYGASTHHDKEYGEMWGWVFDHRWAALLRRCQQEAIAWVERGDWNRALGWEVYRIAMNQWPGHHYKGEHFVDVDDATEDFDLPGDFGKWAVSHPDLAWAPD